MPNHKPLLRVAQRLDLNPQNFPLVIMKQSRKSLFGILNGKPLSVINFVNKSHISGEKLVNAQSDRVTISQLLVYDKLFLLLQKPPDQL